MTDTGRNDLRVLIYAPFGKDAALIERVLAQSSIAICTLPTVLELEEAISEHAGAAIITEEVLQNGTIGALAQKLSVQPPWSDFPIIVLTGSGLSTATTELAVRSRAPLGNVTLLERPLRPVTLISTIRSALLARRRQYEVRDHLEQRRAAEDALQQSRPGSHRGQNQSRHACAGYCDEICALARCPATRGSLDRRYSNPVASAPPSTPG